MTFFLKFLPVPWVQFLVRTRRWLLPLAGGVLLALVFAAGYGKGHEAGGKACLKAEITTQTARAENAEKQRDLANAPPASLDAVLEWLSDDGRAD